MKKLFILIIIQLVCINTNFAQSGFLGSTWNVSAYSEHSIYLLNMGKSYDYTIISKIDETLNNTYVFKKKLITNKFGIDVSKVINDKIQLTAGVNFNNFAVIANKFESVFYDTVYYGSDSSSYNVYENHAVNIALNTSKASYQGLNFEVKFFKNGIAPIGKYLGVNLNIGQSKLYIDNINLATEKQYYNSNLFSFKRDIVDSTRTNLFVNNEYKATSVIFRLSIGNTVPLTKKLGLTYSASLPILKFIKADGRTYNNFLLKPTPQIISMDYFDNYIYNNLAFSILKGNKLAFKLSLVYFI